jgi:hypothetical protein
LLSNFAADCPHLSKFPKKYTHFAQNGHKQIKRLKTASVLGGQREMVQVLWLTIPLIALTMAVYMAYWLMTKITQIIEATKKISPHGVVKRDWRPTGRVDFTTRLNGADDQNKEQPGEFKLLVEEWRMVESLTGNENLEIQWRLAMLSEAKAVVNHYHEHLSENGLIKSIPELSASSFSVKRELSYRPTNGGSEAVSQPT